LQKVVIAVYHQFELWNYPDEHLGILKAAFPDVRFVSVKNDEGIEAELADADVLMTWRMRPELLERANRLRWIHSPAAGVGRMLSPELLATDILVTNSRGVHAVPIAEHVFGVMLCFVRRLWDCFRFQVKGEWGREAIWRTHGATRELSGQTIGIVGFGQIGQEIARIAAAFHMRIVAVRRHPSRNSFPGVEIWPTERLDDLLKCADFVVLAAPLTEETRSLIGEQALRNMKQTAYLINVGRGKLVVESALVRALKAGWIAGAALDVFEREPLPEESELWGLSNVIITFHIAGTTPRYWDRVTEIFAQNLRLFLAGEELKNLVDKESGY
jgi:D-2-hydroxyacid dehydrogenase (NADP+)